MDEAIALVRSLLERERALGLDLIPVAGATGAGIEPVAAPSVEAARPSQVAAKAESAGSTSSASPRRIAVDDLLVEPEIRAAASLAEVRSVLGDCRRCKLCTGRTNIVFGVGDPHADLMFVGEGPGEDEDKQGVPFVGKAGRLLTDIITKGMGLSRESVYIANVVKCRPPGNRNPEPDEILACEPFLERQIALVQPKVVVTLGTFATQALLRNRAPISQQRGRWSDYRGVAVMPTFHPAYLLRNPSGKRTVWEDIQKVMARLELPVPSRPRPQDG